MDWSREKCMELIDMYERWLSDVGQADITTDRILPRCILRAAGNSEVQIPINNLTLTDIKIDREETIIRAEKCEENLQKDGTIMEVLEVEVREDCPDRTTKILTSCDIGTELDISQRKELRALVTRYLTCFAFDVKELGCYSEMPVRIQLTSEEKNMLNSIVKKDKYPLPLVDDELDRLEGKRYFTLLDLKSGYYQMPLENKTAFETPDCHYQFTRLPFGIVNGFPEDDKQGAGTSKVYDSDGFYGCLADSECEY
ncbi:hypothetical protein QE152_g30766 [Popillia japonica]|uniref:Reverse transcriptase n=1 Tax=Popillia japonica TaxID=7064 RepID=A0AAW1JDW4_POPJA